MKVLFDRKNEVIKFIIIYAKILFVWIIEIQKFSMQNYTREPNFLCLFLNWTIFIVFWI